MPLLYLENLTVFKLSLQGTLRQDRREKSSLLGMKVTHREEDTWADFDLGSGFYFGLINPNIISDKRIVGNNAIPVFWADDVDAVFEKVKKQGVEIVSPPENLAFTDYPYRYFQCKDTEGNLIEVAKYERK